MSECHNREINTNQLSWQVKLFLITLVCPPEIMFVVGSFRLSPYRIVLLLFFIPCFLKVFRGKAGGRLITDWLLFAYALWNILALSLNHNWPLALESGGILLVESFGAYLLARSFVRSEIEFSNFVKMLLIVVVLMTVVTVPESITGKNLLRPYIVHIDPRMGLNRAFGSFEHPILYGVFCATSVSLALYVPTGKFFGTIGYKLRTSWMVVATIMSVSSGALVAVIIQLVLAIWNKITIGVAGRWRLLSFVVMIMYFLIDLLSTRSPIRVILHRLTFSAHTAYNRLTIWEWGTKYNVAEHPWFGIGMDVWVRPSWMHSTSMDNFWLVNMVRYGLPSFFFLATSIIILLLTIGEKKTFTRRVNEMRMGWVFSLIGFIVAGWTVHFWNSLLVWFFFLLGSGAWMTQYKTKE